MSVLFGLNSGKVCSIVYHWLSENVNIAWFSKDLFSAKDAIPKLLKSFVIYNIVCPGCNVCYIGEATHHLSARIEEYFEKDKKSYFFKHLNEN